MFDRFNQINVMIDLTRAADAVGLSEDQRRWLATLFDNDCSPSEAGESLGWDERRIARTARSLRPDRPDGAALQEFLHAYFAGIENKSHRPVLKIEDLEQHGIRAKTKGTSHVLLRALDGVQQLFKTKAEKEAEIEGDLRRRLRFARLDQRNS